MVQASPEHKSVADVSVLKPFECSDGQKICLDDANFDPVHVMDLLLGEDAVLEDVKNLMMVLEQQAAHVDHQVLKAVRQQSVRASRAQHELQKAQEDITAISSDIATIERRAEDTEGNVEVICKDIRSMDYAKRHLTTSISALENFGTLTDAVAHLEATGLQRELYEANARKLEGVMLLMEKFDKYHHVAKLAKLKGSVDTMTQNLKSQVMHDFKINWAFIDPLQNLPVRDEASFEERERVRAARVQHLREAKPKLETLRGACLLASALGSKAKAKDEIIDYVINTWLEQFKAFKLFTQPGKALDESFTFKFQWMQSILSDPFFTEQWKVFPEDWKVQQQMALRFCAIMKKQMTSELEAYTANLPAEDASKPLLEALRVTRTFEAFLQGKIEGKKGPGPDGDKASDAAKRRLLAQMASHKLETQPSSPSDKPVFIGLLADVFLEYLQPYVDYEKRQLLQELDTHWAADKAANFVPQMASHKLDSTTALLMRIRDVAERCSKVASKGKMFIKFASVVDEVLKAYCSRLQSKLPVGKSAKGGAAEKSRGAFSEVEMTASDVQLVCAIIASADYCEQVIPQMADFMCSLCDGDMAAEINLDGARDAFEAVAAQGLNCIINGLLTQLTKHVDGPSPSGSADGIAVMAAGSHLWQLESTGDTNKYARAIGDTLRAWGAACYKGLVTYDEEYSANDNAFWHLCNKVLLVFVQYLKEHGLMRLRKLNNIALQQLSIDMNSVAEDLRAFPLEAYKLAKLDSQSEFPAKSYEEYKKLVTTHMGPIVNVTKVLATEDDSLFITAYRALLPKEYQTAAELSKLLMLPDMKQEQRDHRMLKFTSHGEVAGASLRRNPTSTAGAGVLSSAGGALGSGSRVSDAQLATTSGWSATMTSMTSMRNMANITASGLSGAASSLSTHGAKALKGASEFSKKSFFKF